MTLYKVLSHRRRSCHGGSTLWLWATEDIGNGWVRAYIQLDGATDASWVPTGEKP